MPRLCGGLDAGGGNFEGCVFSATKPGQKAVAPSGACLWCDSENMAAACADFRRRARLAQSLKKFNDDVKERAMGRISMRYNPDCLRRNDVMLEL